MVSMLVRAARGALATSRAAVAGRSGAAAGDLVLGSCPNARRYLTGEACLKRRLFGGTRHGVATRCLCSSHSDSSVAVDPQRFVLEEKDLESDEALWALYERWCKHFDMQRDRDEMAHWFNHFKEAAHRVHEVNNSNLSYRLELNMFADGKLAEAIFPAQKAGIQAGLKELEDMPKGSCFYWRDGKYHRKY
ncbi:hypothetical protein ACP70R_035791 [Stipagrostis hirtigluma subsp. patula]